MSIDFRVGTFSQLVNTLIDIGFSPKAMLAMWANLDQGNSVSDCIFAMGCQAAAGVGAAVSSYSDDNIAASNLARSRFSSGGPLVKVYDQTGGFNFIDLGISSYQPLGFIPNPIVTDGNPKLVEYMALAGTDIINVSTFGGAFSGGIGNKDFALGFTPHPTDHLVILFGTTLSGLDNQVNATGTIYSFLGICTPQGSCYVAGSERDAINPSSVWRRSKNGYAYGIVDEVAGGIFDEGQYIGSIANGIRFNATTGGMPRVYGIVIDGLRVEIQPIITPSAPGNQIIRPTLPGYLEGAMILHACHAPDTGVPISGIRNGYGAVDTLGNQWHVQQMAKHGVTPTEEDTRLSTNNCFQCWDNGGATLEFAAVGSIANNALTLNYFTATAGLNYEAFAILLLSKASWIRGGNFKALNNK